MKSLAKTQYLLYLTSRLINNIIFTLFTEGKFGHKSFEKLVFEFATYPKPTPEFDIVLPIFTKP